MNLIEKILRKIAEIAEKNVIEDLEQAGWIAKAILKLNEFAFKNPNIIKIILIGLPAIILTIAIILARRYNR